MSTVSLRHPRLKPQELFAAVTGDQVTLHAAAFVWQGTIIEFHELVEAGWEAIYLAVAHQEKLAGMLPEAGVK